MASTVSVTCPECEKQIKAPAEIVGKKIRCKSCAHVFVAKADAEPSKPAPAKGGKAPPAKAAPDKGITKAPAKPAKPKDDEDEENANPYGVTTLDTTTRCPNCANEMESEKAVVCLTCGYNTLTREQVRTRKVHDPTGGERFLWLLPGILSAIGVLLIIGNIIVNLIMVKNYTPDGEDSKLWEQAAGCYAVWWTLGWLWVGYKATRFAIKRLIQEPTPPEVEK
jgi:DNA-directed RNA polymerase subunit RPC12/RpoP